ncbi:MAG: beta-galactosidase [Halothiobacillaceae bacterium]
MNIIQAIFLIFLALIASSATAATKNVAESQKDIAILVYPYQFTDTALIQKLQDAGASVATVSIPWRVVEPSSGQFDFGAYDDFLDALVAAGFELNLLLDAGGRPFLDERGEVIPGETVIPPWVKARHPDGFSTDFEGIVSSEPSVFHAEIQALISRFFEEATRYYVRRYGDGVSSFAIGIQTEHEIKYGQEGYRWRDYGQAARLAFREKYGQELPKLNFASEIASAPRVIPSREALAEFRRNALADAVCSLSDVIREAGGKPAGYFGEFFNSHDGIYGLDVVDVLPGCLDLAIVDFNFYDGWARVPDPEVLPLLVNYARGLGYHEVKAGLYFERWRVGPGAKSPMLPEADDLLLKSVARLDEADGIELGGFGALDPSVVELVSKASRALPRISAKSPDGRTIGVLAARSTFTLWHGERSHGRNIHHDALVRMFELLRAQPGFEVRVVGEAALGENIDELDAIVVPHQSALSDRTRTMLREYAREGGVLIQDMRMGEFEASGRNTGHWENALFGIDSIEWKRSPTGACVDGRLITVTPPSDGHLAFAGLGARPGYRLLVNLGGSSGEGVFLKGDNTLVLGLMPQLQRGAASFIWRRLFIAQLRKMLSLEEPANRIDLFYPLEEGALPECRP